ncbi:MAG: tetraacyldisaccharide 4'-kinase [Flavobacterium sp.]|nr:tetraacyldisaccharide 4'-kinase [Flavobacterium sp.]
MKFLRKLLFPFALVYAAVLHIRNFLYDKAIFTSSAPSIPVIAVGNLSVGGTGKTPMIEYLIRLLQSQYTVAVLSRGYKRKSTGFILANETTSVQELGDEPFQYHQKFPEITVAVDANRSNGINQIQNQKPNTQVILLDDAFQHRKVKASLYLLLTAYNDFFYDDFVLPMGNLREARSGKKRAHSIVVTKCPPALSAVEQANIKAKLGVTQPVFFTSIGYDQQVYSSNTRLLVADIKTQQKVLLAGIAKPKPFFQALQSGQDQELIYPDHHNFSAAELAKIERITTQKLVITTEKDYVRLQPQLPENSLYYLPIQTQFIAEEAAFVQFIKSHVESSTRNR